MLLGLQPSHLPTTLGQLNAISDHVWWWAGDRTTDASWYVKRGLLLKAYVLTETHLLAD